MFKGEKVFPNQKYSVTKRGNSIFLKRDHLDNHIPNNQKIIFTGPSFDRNELETIKTVKVAEMIANVIALKKKHIDVQDEWDVFINGDDGYSCDTALPYELRLHRAYKFIQNNLNEIPNTSY